MSKSSGTRTDKKTLQCSVGHFPKDFSMGAILDEPSRQAEELCSQPQTKRTSRLQETQERALEDASDALENARQGMPSRLIYMYPHMKAMASHRDESISGIQEVRRT